MILQASFLPDWLTFWQTENYEFSATQKSLIILFIILFSFESTFNAGDTIDDAEAPSNKSPASRNALNKQILFFIVFQSY